MLLGRLVWAVVAPGPQPDLGRGRPSIRHVDAFGSIAHAPQLHEGCDGARRNSPTLSTRTTQTMAGRREHPRCRTRPRLGASGYSSDTERRQLAAVDPSIDLQGADLLVAARRPDSRVRYHASEFCCPIVGADNEPLEIVATAIEVPVLAHLAVRDAMSEFVTPIMLRTTAVGASGRCDIPDHRRKHRRGFKRQPLGTGTDLRPNV